MNPYLYYNQNYVLSQYDENLYKILNEGFDIEGDRTGVGTKCAFGLSTTIDISKRVPVLTRRRVAWKSIVKEVLWYISGSHSINDLEAMGAGIWTPWKSKKFTDRVGLPEGSGGYIYGHNLIHFGAKIFSDGSLSSDGFNQLDYVINTLKENPKSRQACFTFWRPDTNDEAILPACHAFYSFIVSPDENGEMKRLSCHMFQRSNDYPIGVGMGNLFTGTLFTYLIAQQLDMKPWKLYHSGAHCHIYHNAIEATKEYFSREIAPNSPVLKINKKASIYDYKPEDFELEGYNPLPKIDFPIAV